ncbi:alpha-ribazole phosphatase [Chitinophaga sp. sic0106]|uniref:alpha-ribazole phosphatase n=1 Tax=Chitinophaga sp. sic0106 TaxID=2854785 RepID=UPI001C483600|nr:alpha-ribazole phosphatase [Chitinophaga sp. sic0106]MBV7533456.1 alpha-ribazole phosphatase [Chitinophaga sp. sic0106]
MEIYLIRHTTPAVERGICYGFTDIDVAPTFETEAARIKGLLPAKPMDVYASPLQRCSKLATYLFGNTFTTDDRLKELNFGDWEMQRWDDLGPDALQKWMDDFVYVRVPNGESYQDLYARAVEILNEVIAKGRDAVLVTHSGIIRALLAHITDTPLEKSFERRTEYGRIACLSVTDNQVNIVFYNS